jgi:hypothetical protein
MFQAPAIRSIHPVTFTPIGNEHARRGCCMAHLNLLQGLFCGRRTKRNCAGRSDRRSGVTFGTGRTMPPSPFPSPGGRGDSMVNGRGGSGGVGRRGRWRR